MPRVAYAAILEGPRKPITLKIVCDHLRASLRRVETNVALANKAQFEDRDLFVALRDGAIQSFEFCYTMSIRAVERVTAARGDAVAFEAADFRTRLRMAWEFGLVSSVAEWADFREMRNKTSHTYNEAKATEVFANIPRFIIAARQLLTTLENLDEHQA